MSDPTDALATALHGCCHAAGTTEHAQHVIDRLPEGTAIVTVESLAAALERYYPGLISGPRVEDYPPSKTRKGMQMARAIIAAAKEAERD